MGVRGLINIQFALAGDTLFVLEANPRASRTVPFVSKATDTPLAKAAARIAVGETVADLRASGVLPATGDGTDLPEGAPIAVKEAVLPFNRFRTVEGHGVDTLLSPEMKSTGEVMGLDTEFGTAFAKSQAAAYGSLPTEGTVFVLDGTELLMELVTDGDLPAPRLAQARAPRERLASYFDQLCEALATLTQAGLVHGDLSAYNLLAAGDRLGELVVTIPGGATARTPLIAAADVAEAGFFGRLQTAAWRLGLRAYEEAQGG